MPGWIARTLRRKIFFTFKVGDDVHTVGVVYPVNRKAEAAIIASLTTWWTEACVVAGVNADEAERLRKRIESEVGVFRYKHGVEHMICSSKVSTELLITDRLRIWKKHAPR
jgi:hypothetical protein